jgi:hypothetical protein
VGWGSRSLEQLKEQGRAFALQEREKCVKMHRRMAEAQKEVNRRSLT